MLDYETNDEAHFQCPQCGQKGSVPKATLEKALAETPHVYISCSNCADKFEPFAPDEESAIDDGAPQGDAASAPASSPSAPASPLEEHWAQHDENAEATDAAADADKGHLPGWMMPVEKLQSEAREPDDAADEEPNDAPHEGETNVETGSSTAIEAGADEAIAEEMATDTAPEEAAEPEVAAEPEEVEPEEAAADDVLAEQSPPEPASEQIETPIAAPAMDAADTTTDTIDAPDALEAMNAPPRRATRHAPICRRRPVRGAARQRTDRHA